MVASLIAALKLLVCQACRECWIRLNQPGAVCCCTGPLLTTQLQFAVTGLVDVCSGHGARMILSGMGLQTASYTADMTGGALEAPASSSAASASKGAAIQLTQQQHFRSSECCVDIVKQQRCKTSPAKGAAIEAMQQQHRGSARACWPPLLVVQPDAVYCDKFAVSICQSFGADCVIQGGWRSLREGLHQALEPGNGLLPELLT